MPKSQKKPDLVRTRIKQGRNRQEVVKTAVGHPKKSEVRIFCVVLLVYWLETESN